MGRTVPRIDRHEDYPPDSLGAYVLRICDEAEAALPGSGEVLLTAWNCDDPDDQP